MSGSLISGNTTVKVNRALTGGETVNAGAYAVASYIGTGNSGTGTGGVNATTTPNVLYYGPGQTVLASVITKYVVNSATFDITYTLISGVEFINSP